MPALNHFDPATFLLDHWQKRPVVIRGALAPDLFPLSPAELAGLACEDDIESRLILGNQAEGFELRHGPFSETSFTALPERDWTVLVQAVDFVVPEVAALLDYFRFIPNWRIDDIMVSFAAPGGSAGPHYDNYDVFLIQGRGTRHWKVGDPVDASAELAPHPQLHLLEHFDPVDEWELQPGDILYLPPRYAHWGISTSADCMTYSVGFRAPSRIELIDEYCQHAMDSLSEFDRYEDPDLSLQNSPGEISGAAVEKVRKILLQALSNDADIAEWLGRYMTLPKYDRQWADFGEDRQAIDFERKLKHFEHLHRDPASRFAYSNHSDAPHLFVNGTTYTLSPGQSEFARYLCDSTELKSRELQQYLREPALSAIAVALYQQGSLYFEDELHDCENDLEGE